MWGKVFSGRDILFLSRFNPTCVGKRSSMTRFSAVIAKSPHVCGEKFCFCIFVDGLYEKSPRVWGKAESLSKFFSMYRKVPTCVGKSLSTFPKIGQTAKSPHVCGEKRDLRWKTRSHPEKSPRVWGKVICSIVSSKSPRFNPTCVGKSKTLLIRALLATVQPHVCGEK